jgi:hypothetical protein
VFDFCAQNAFNKIKDVIIIEDYFFPRHFSQTKPFEIFKLHHLKASKVCRVQHQIDVATYASISRVGFLDITLARSSKF